MTLRVERRTERFVAPDGTKLAYQLVGDGPPLVCVPGGPGRASAYLEDLAGVAAERRLVALDNPGTGASERPREPSGYGFPALAANLETLREALAVDRMTLLGHSAGALVSELYATQHVDRVDRLLLVTPAGWPHTVNRDDVDAIKHARSEEPWYEHSMHTLTQPEDTVPERERTLAFRPFMYGGWDERQQAHAASADEQQDAAAEAGYWQPGDLEQDAVRRVAGNISVPVLVIAGERDAVTGVSAARAVAADLPRAELVVLPGCGHFPWVDDPAAFRRTVLNFLR